MKERAGVPDAGPFMLFALDVAPRFCRLTLCFLVEREDDEQLCHCLGVGEASAIIQNGLVDELLRRNIPVRVLDII